ncbi:hypothetical protein MAR_020268 [Mya arenaria]|uniref:Immunoglobulin subtype domain-containing protein n=1 Tax=Mya arenaria TaxID=6604 RepID=A0ABY7E6W5_MYAAR|nr:hypothetical protein MAR_020268 [Mya arenaria]
MMGYNVCIFKILYILCFLPSLYCEVCGTLQNLNNGTINRGDDVRLEFSNFDRKHTDLVRWWKNDKNIDTTLPRFSVDVQHGRVTLIICSFTVEDNGGYSVSFGGIQCSPPKTILITVKEPKVLSAIPQFPDNVTIPELDCEQCLVGTVGVYINVECVVFGISKKDLTEEGALIYADLDLPTESSTRGKSTVSLDAGTTYVSIDLTQTEKKKRSELND